MIRIAGLGAVASLGLTAIVIAGPTGVQTGLEKMQG